MLRIARYLAFSLVSLVLELVPPVDFFVPLTLFFNGRETTGLY